MFKKIKKWIAVKIIPSESYSITETDNSALHSLRAEYELLIYLTYVLLLPQLYKYLYQR